MPIKAQSAHVVILYGKSACEQFEPMIRFFQTALDSSSWEHLCFVCASPDAAYPPPLSDLPPNLLCVPAYIDAGKRATLSQQTVEAIHARCINSSVYFHIVCDDFKAQTLDNASIPLLLDGLKQYFEDRCHLLLYTFVYMFLDDSAGARKAQRQFAQALVHCDGMQIYPYLISRLLSNGTTCKEWHMWRATMCEILAVIAQCRAAERDTVYSLGYTSLNANNEELHALRWKALGSAFEDECNRPLSATEVWYMLTGDANVLDTQFGDEYQMYSLVLKWLTRLAEKSSRHPSPQTLHNFRQLAGIAQQQNPSEISKLVQRFYELNFSNIESISTYARSHMDGFLKKLSCQPNASNLPTLLLDKLTYTLGRVMEQQSETQPLPTLTPKRLLQTNASYASQCSAQYEEYFERHLTRTMIREYARAFRDEFARIRVFIRNAAQIAETLSGMLEDETAQLPQGGKYLRYEEDINNTLLQHRTSLFPRMTLFDAGDGRPDEAAIRALLTKADATLHGNMSRGFKGTFIDAIRTEFNTPEALALFQNNYLSNQCSMFHSLCEPMTQFENLKFSDVNLGIPAGANGHLLIHNDNVELLSRYVLTHNLAFFVGDEIQSEQNHFFAGDDACFPSFPTAAGGVHHSPAPEHIASSLHKPLNAPSGETDTNPCRIRLTTRNGESLLVWDWNQGVTSVTVELNNRPQTIETIMQFNLDHGYIVTRLLKHGRNDVTIRLDDGSLYGQLTFQGPRVKVRYNLPSNGSLSVENIGPNIDKLVLCETAGGQSTYYPLYPVGLNRDLCIYGNLKLQGAAALQCDPREKYPIFQPEIDYAL